MRMIPLRILVIVLCFANVLGGGAKTSPFLHSTHIPTTEDRAGTNGVTCVSVDPSVIRSNEGNRDKCCRRYYKGFRKGWFKSRRRLGDILNILHVWNCPQFEEECKERTFDFTEFTSNLYDKFCKPSRYAAKCGNNTSIASIGASSPRISGMTLDESAESVEISEKVVEESEGVSNMTIESLLSPCVQASLVIAGRIRKSEYFEIKNIEIPFCDIIWCAFPMESFFKYDITISTCMPNRCRISLYIFMSATAILCAGIFIANVTVLVVFSTTGRKLNSQTMFKISLAVADLLAGIFVLPSMIETTRRSFLFPFVPIDENNSQNSQNYTKVENFEYSPQFTGVAGFFTTLSLTVSIYTLLVASFDRFSIVYRPLLYDKFRALRVAKIALGILWFIAIIFSILPFCTESLYYNYVSSVFVSMGGHVAVIIYCVAIGIPLVLVWIVNIMTFIFYRRNARKSRNLTSTPAHIQMDKTEKRLLKTLSIMVGVFTLCLLPLVVMMLCTMFMDGVNIMNPTGLNPTRLSAVRSAEAGCVFILMSNSLWNFFIYNGRSREFRSAAISLYKRIVGKILPGNACLTKSRQADSVRKRFKFTRQNTSTFEKSSEATTQSTAQLPTKAEPLQPTMNTV